MTVPSLGAASRAPHGRLCWGLPHRGPAPTLSGPQAGPNGPTWPPGRGPDPWPGSQASALCWPPHPGRTALPAATPPQGTVSCVGTGGWDRGRALPTHAAVARHTRVPGERCQAARRTRRGRLSRPAAAPCGLPAAARGRTQTQHPPSPTAGRLRGSLASPWVLGWAKPLPAPQAPCTTCPGAGSVSVQPEAQPVPATRPQAGGGCPMSGPDRGDPSRPPRQERCTAAALEAEPPPGIPIEGLAVCPPPWGGSSCPAAASPSPSCTMLSGDACRGPWAQSQPRWPSRPVSAGAEHLRP